MSKVDASKAMERLIRQCQTLEQAAETVRRIINTSGTGQ